MVFSREGGDLMCNEVVSPPLHGPAAAARRGGRPPGAAIPIAPTSATAGRGRRCKASIEAGVIVKTIGIPYVLYGNVRV